LDAYSATVAFFTLSTACPLGLHASLQSNFGGPFRYLLSLSKENEVHLVRINTESHLFRPLTYLPQCWYNNGAEGRWTDARKI